MDAQAAARLGNEIAHGFGGMSMIAGAVAGALIGAAVIAATVATGGVAVAIMAGSIAAGGLSVFQIVKGLNTLFNLPEATSGKLLKAVSMSISMASMRCERERTSPRPVPVFR